MCLDFDDIPVTEIETLALKINQCDYTLASFISPSGEGLKVFIKVNIWLSPSASNSQDNVKPLMLVVPSQTSV